jgi:type II secretory pathway component PulM
MASSPPDKRQLDDDPIDCRIGVERLPLGLRQVSQEKPDEFLALPIGTASAKVGFALVAGGNVLSAARTASFLALVLYWSLFPFAALAQEREMPSPITPAERAQAMIEQITNDFARLEALRAEPLPDATAEARAIRDRRIGDEELRIGRRVRDLANLVLEAEGDPAMDSVRAKVVGWLQELPAGASLTVERRTEELQAARAARELATADEQNAAELRLTAARKSLNTTPNGYR